MASTKVELPMLDRKTNFTLWKIKMRGVLAQLDLEDALVVPMPESWNEDKKKRINWKALTQIQLHLSNDILRDVQKETEAHKLWSRLEEICMAKTVTRRNLAKQRLFGLRMVEGTSLESHLANFKYIMAELDALDANTLIEEDLCSLLLMSLPPSFSGFRDILFYGSKESMSKLSLETIYEDLSSKESMSKLSESATPSEGEGLLFEDVTPRRRKILLEVVLSLVI